MNVERYCSLLAFWRNESKSPSCRYSGITAASGGLVGVLPLETGVRGKKGKAIRGQAFGVGAFEEEDEDVYAQLGKEAYDFALGEGPGMGKGSAQGGGAEQAFKPAKEPLAPRQFFHKPKLPRDFQPIHKPVKIAAAAEVLSVAKDKRVPFLPLHAPRKSLP